jgi:hypothetical protein
MGNKLLQFMLIALISGTAFAQDSTRIGTKYGFLPAFSFNSDNGIYIGTEIQVYDYGDMQPFKSYTRVSASYQTIGAFGITLFRDQVKTFGTNIRTSIDFHSSQNLGNYFLGDTEEIEFNQASFDTSLYYKFKSFRITGGITSRHPINFGEGISRSDFKMGLRLVYESPWDNQSNRFISDQRYEGYDGAYLTFFEFGFLWERRDNEFVAQSGYKIDVGTKIAPPLISTHPTIENYFNFNGFYPLVKKGRRSLTIATRLFLQNTIGDTPYWFVPNIGGSNTIRGVFFRRFSSDNAFSYSLEARTWLIPIKYKNINLGLNFFIDGGRVFKNDDWGGILSDHIHSLGLGGVMSIFTPDFILKYEMGFSEIGTGVFLGTGYSF